MKIQVLGYDDVSTGIMEPEDRQNNLLWKIGKYLPIDKMSYLRTLESSSRWFRKPQGSKVRLLCAVTPSWGKLSYSSVIIMFILFLH
jgi:hypothetical protein